MKYKLTVIMSVILFIFPFSACDSDSSNKQDNEETTKADTTIKEDKSNPNTISEQYESKNKQTWRSQDNLIEFVCDGEYGVEGWGIYSGYYNYQNQKYKLNVEISEYYDHKIEFYYDAEGKGVNYDVSDGESVDKGIVFLFGDIKHIDEKTFSVTVDGGGGSSVTKDDLPFEIPYQYEDVIVFEMVNSKSELEYQYDSETETVTILSFGNTVDYDQTDAYDKLQEITHPTNIVISEGITSIPDYFFSYSIEGASGKERNHFNQIKNVKIPNTVIKIGDSAFSYCYGLEAVSIPDSVNEIGESAFEECKNLTKVKIGKGILKLSSNLFMNCEKLNSVIMTEGLTEIGKKAFVCCKNLSEIHLPKTVDTIGESAFSGCSAIESITLPERLKTLESYSFFECPKLKTITIPQSTEIIGEYAIGYVSDLKNDELFDSPISDFTIHGKRGTVAEKYATENGFYFVY